MKEPTADHPITIDPSGKAITVIADGSPIAESADALRMQEADYAPVFYIPRTDVDMSRLTRSEHETYCPFKGTASYFHLAGGDTTVENAVWTYEAPYPAVTEIKDHLAFYPNAVEVIEKAEA